MKYVFFLIINNLICFSIFSQNIEIFKTLEKSDTIKNFNVTMQVPKLLSVEMNNKVETIFYNQFEKHVVELVSFRDQELENDIKSGGPGAEYRSFTMDLFLKVFDVVYDENDIYVVYNQMFGSQYTRNRIGDNAFEDYYVKILRISDIKNEIKNKPIKSLFVNEENCDAFFSLIPFWLPECGKAKLNNFSGSLIGKSILIKDKVLVYVDNTFFDFKRFEDEENDCGKYPNIFGTIKKVEIPLDDIIKKYIKPKTIIKTQKSFFYSAPNKPKKMYLIKGDEIDVLDYYDYDFEKNIEFKSYLHVRYYGKKTIEGWIKKSDVE